MASQMKDMMEFSICSDIASRTALYVLAKSCNKDEMDSFYLILKESLADGGYESSKSDPIVEQYRVAAHGLRDEFDASR